MSHDVLDTDADLASLLALLDQVWHLPNEAFEQALFLRGFTALDMRKEGVKGILHVIR